MPHAGCRLCLTQGGSFKAKKNDQGKFKSFFFFKFLVTNNVLHGRNPTKQEADIYSALVSQHLFLVLRVADFSASFASFLTKKYY